MSAAGLLVSLTLRGISLRADGDWLVVDPIAAVTEDEKASLRAEKPVLLRLLRVVATAHPSDALVSAVEAIREVEVLGLGLWINQSDRLALWRGGHIDDEAPVDLGDQLSEELLIHLVQHHDQIERLIRWRYLSRLDDVALVGETDEQTTANLICEAERHGAKFFLSASQGVEVDSPPVWAVNPPTEYLERLLRALDRTWHQVEVAIRRRSAAEPPAPLAIAPEIDGGKLQDKRSALACDKWEADEELSLLDYAGKVFGWHEDWPEAQPSNWDNLPAFDSTPKNE